MLDDEDHEATLERIGRELRVSRTTIQRIEARAMSKLRKVFRIPFKRWPDAYPVIDELRFLEALRDAEPVRPVEPVSDGDAYDLAGDHPTLEAHAYGIMLAQGSREHRGRRTCPRRHVWVGGGVATFIDDRRKVRRK